MITTCFKFINNFRLNSQHSGGVLGLYDHSTLIMNKKVVTSSSKIMRDSAKAYLDAIQLIIYLVFLEEVGSVHFRPTYINQELWMRRYPKYDGCKLHSHFMLQRPLLHGGHGRFFIESREKNIGYLKFNRENIYTNFGLIIDWMKIPIQ